LQNFVQSETVWQANKQASSAKMAQNSGLHLVQFSHCRRAKIRCVKAWLAKPCRRGKFCKISFSPRLYGKLTSKQAQPKCVKAWLAKPCRRGKFCKISFSPRLYGKLTSKQAQPKWRKTRACIWFNFHTAVGRKYGVKAWLAKPCRRGKFCKISFSPRLYGKLTSKQAQPKWRKTRACIWFNFHTAVGRKYGV
jgi:hypothetical protein